MSIEVQFEFIIVWLKQTFKCTIFRRNSSPTSGEGGETSSQVGRFDKAKLYECEIASWNFRW